MDLSKSNARRFLDAFNRIERALRHANTAGSANDGWRGFAQLVKASKELHPRQRDQLLEYGELRNVIVHNPYNEADEPYADPRPATVDWIEAQADVIERPPLVMKVLKLQPPTVLEESDDISAFLSLVGLPYNFSQAPVAARGGISLVTTNAVARWISAAYELGAGVALNSAPITTVLEFAERGDRLVVRAQGLKVVEALKIFGGEVGEPPAAILLTQNGRAKEKPLGMCVRADVPDLLSSIRV